MGGSLGLTNEINTRVDDDLIRSETVALPTTLVLLIVVFGGVIAALLPLALGVTSIVATWLVLLVLSEVTAVSVYALIVATAFGLGLAIDFGLFMVSRFREERDGGHEPRQAVVEAVATAGETILFSASTIALAMASMLVFPIYFLRSVGLAAIAVVTVAAIGAVVVLPAMLALAGDRVDSLVIFRRRAKVSAESPFWRGIGGVRDATAGAHGAARGGVADPPGRAGPARPVCPGGRAGAAGGLVGPPGQHGPGRELPHGPHTGDLRGRDYRRRETGAARRRPLDSSRRGRRRRPVRPHFRRRSHFRTGAGERPVRLRGRRLSPRPYRRFRRSRTPHRASSGRSGPRPKSPSRGCSSAGLRPL